MIFKSVRRKKSYLDIFSLPCLWLLPCLCYVTAVNTCCCLHFIAFCISFAGRYVGGKTASGEDAEP